MSSTHVKVNLELAACCASSDLVRDRHLRVRPLLPLLTHLVLGVEVLIKALLGRGLDLDPVCKHGRDERECVDDKSPAAHGGWTARGS